MRIYLTKPKDKLTRLATWSHVTNKVTWTNEATWLDLWRACMFASAEGYSLIVEP